MKWINRLDDEELRELYERLLEEKETFGNFKIFRREGKIILTAEISGEISEYPRPAHKTFSVKDMRADALDFNRPFTTELTDFMTEKFGDEYEAERIRYEPDVHWANRLTPEDMLEIYSRICMLDGDELIDFETERTASGYLLESFILCTFEDTEKKQPYLESYLLDDFYLTTAHAPDDRRNCGGAYRAYMRRKFGEEYDRDFRKNG